MGSLSNLSAILGPVMTMAGIPGGTLIGTGLSLMGQQNQRNELRQQQDLAMSQLQARQAQDEDIARQNLTLEKTKIAADASVAEERRRNALRRAVARQKTLFSAQGVSGMDGSNEAVLLGMFNDVQSEQNASNQADSLRQAALEQGLSQQKQKNLLELSELSERQNLSRVLSGY